MVSIVLRSQFCSIFLSNNSGKVTTSLNQVSTTKCSREGALAPLIFFRDFTVMTNTAIRMKACDISGLSDAIVWDHSSVPYFCLTTAGRSILTNLNQVSTKKCSREGALLFSSGILQWWRILQSERERLYCTKLESLWKRSSGLSLGSNLMLCKSKKCALVEPESKVHAYCLQYVA